MKTKTTLFVFRSLSNGCKSMITAGCHCDAVHLEVRRRPRTLTSCNCTICRRYGTLWAYYKVSSVRVRAPRGGVQRYTWGGRRLRFVRCRQCGCIMYWEPTRPQADSRMGVNARNFPPEVLDGIRVRRLDGARTWKYLD